MHAHKDTKSKSSGKVTKLGKSTRKKSVLDFLSLLGLSVVVLVIGTPPLVYVQHEIRVTLARGRWCTIYYVPTDFGLGQGQALRMRTDTQYGNDCDRIQVSDYVKAAGTGDSFYVRQYGSGISSKGGL